jgi:ribosomal protein S18 acetylase RimI-like enzyme
MMEFVFAESKELLSIVRELFNEYASSLDFDLCFQNFDKELTELPGKYAPPDGRLIVAMNGTNVAGCVALRNLTKGICEMKRLYVRPEFRGKGIGKELVKVIIEEAKKIGYTHMRLDTVPAMKEAIALYRSIGFYEIEPYRNNPIEGAIFMEFNLENLSDTN